MSGEFTEDQIDALTELINIGVGRAAASLSEMINLHINLMVPKVQVGHINLLHKTVTDSDVSVVEQHFAGTFKGMSALMFPTASAATMVCLLLGEELNTDIDLDELEAERESVLTEVGNVLINSIMGSLGNILNEHLDYHLPKFKEQALAQLCAVWAQQADGMLMAEVRFEVADSSVTGSFLVLFELGSLAKLRECLTALLN